MRKSQIITSIIVLILILTSISACASNNKSFEDNGKIKRSDIEKKIDLKKSQILQIINKLREYNLVLKTGQGVNTKYMIK